MANTLHLSTDLAKSLLKRTAHALHKEEVGQRVKNGCDGAQMLMWKKKHVAFGCKKTCGLKQKKSIKSLGNQRTFQRSNLNKKEDRREAVQTNSKGLKHVKTIKKKQQ